MADEVIDKLKRKLQKGISNFEFELGKIRAGRANASLVNDIMVDYYGAPTPLKQIASVSIPEARVIQITPFDKSSLKGIEAAINKSDLGINPSVDGGTIRLIIPQLTGESRQEIVKEVKKIAEEAKVMVRSGRRDALDELKKQQKNGDISEDILHKREIDVKKVHDEFINKIDQITLDKESEISKI